MGTMEERVTALEQTLQANDRRYTEVAQEREKALKIKEEADKDALRLAREIQTYKDEKAIAQIEGERGSYATQSDLKTLSDRFDEQHAPVLQYINSESGRRQGVSVSAGVLVAVITAVPVTVLLVAHLVK